jgi:hypothetical protein
MSVAIDGKATLVAQPAGPAQAWLSGIVKQARLVVEQPPGNGHHQRRTIGCIRAVRSASDGSRLWRPAPGQQQLDQDDEDRKAKVPTIDQKAVSLYALVVGPDGRRPPCWWRTG